MDKQNKIIYWVATAWLCLGMLSTGLVQWLHTKEEVARMNQLGYPLYLLSIVGGWKLLGVLAVLSPRFPLLKEWAYAGFFFLTSGALFSHAANSDPAAEFFGPLLLLLLTFVSWHFRPGTRRLHYVHS